MNIKELDNEIEKILEQETKNLILEQINVKQVVEGDVDSIRNFQTLSGLADKISNIENVGNGEFGAVVNINNITPEELLDCCGGASLEETQKNLMQGLHHDLEDNGLGNNFDIDVDTQGDENSLNLIIKITANKDELSGDSEMKEKIKDTNPTIDDKKDVILGNKEALGVKNESAKKIITLNEGQMKELLKKIIKEAATAKKPEVDATTEQAQSDSKKQNDEALRAVEKKIKDYLSFKGNDNPEFPNQIGQGEEKNARVATTAEEDMIDTNRGRGPQDLDYDSDGLDDNGEPNKKFQDRMEKGLTGDSTMGNGEGLNSIKTDTGKKMLDVRKKKLDARKKEPIYPKEAVPVDTKPDPKLGRTVSESVVKEEIEKMKRMASYNEKTQ